MSLEVDYEENMTLVYKFISAGSWDIAIRAIKRKPEEARTWVLKKSRESSDIEFRLLPIHSACALQPPSTVIEALVDAYPQGVKLADNQGMYPIHYACANLASKEVIEKLLVTFPEGLNVADPEGMLPLHHIAQWGAVSMSVVELLLQYCNDSMMTAEDQKGNTALDLAYESNYDNRDELIFAFEEFCSKQHSLPHAVRKLHSELNVEVIAADETISSIEGSGQELIEHSSPKSVLTTNHCFDSTKYKSLKDENEILKTELAKMCEMCEDFKLKTKSFKDEVNAMTGILTEYKAKLDQCDKESRRKIESLKKDNETLQSLMQSIEKKTDEELEMSSKENVELKSEINSLEQEVFQLSSSLTSAMGQHTIITSALLEQRNTVSSLSTLVSSKEVNSISED